MLFRYFFSRYSGNMPLSTKVWYSFVFSSFHLQILFFRITIFSICIQGVRKYIFKYGMRIIAYFSWIILLIYIFFENPFSIIRIWSWKAPAYYSLVIFILQFVQQKIPLQFHIFPRSFTLIWSEISLMTWSNTLISRRHAAWIWGQQLLLPLLPQWLWPM